MKKIVLQLFMCALSLNATAQKINLEEALPVDKSIKKGILPNGMTYYIKSTDVTKGTASFYIIQNVGSILENDDQQGLAHFLEHMAFNGTKNFKDKGILNTMQKQGLIFGRDINAYTSFDETVYNVNNIPTTPELIDKGLLILHDWSHYLLLTDKEIDAERGVIKEEWRTRQNAGMRIFEKTSDVVFNHSKYARRMPIGLMKVVDNFKYSTLSDFYHDWYRTNLQAIAVIGDIDPGVIEAKIKALFSQIPAVKNPKERLIVDIPDNKDLLYTMAVDDEITTASLSLGIRQPKSLKNQTTADLKEDLINAMVIKMLSNRIEELGQKSASPFLEASVNLSDDSRTTKIFDISISPKAQQQKAAFVAVLSEVNRAVKFGFTNAEIKRTILAFESFYQNQIISKDDRTHEEIESLIQKNYLDNQTMIDVEDEYKLVQAIFGQLKADEIQQAVKKLYSIKNRFLVVTGVKGDDNLNQQDALRIISEVENDTTLKAYTDEFEGKTLISNLEITPGSIVSEKIDEQLGSTTYSLSNGITVHYKFANKNKNDVQLKAISYGGNSLLSDADLPSASALGSVLQASGLGSYSVVDLPKVLAGKNANVLVNISPINESIAGSTVTKDTETMLQMIYLRFMKPRFDAQGYHIVMENMKNKLISRSENVQDKIEDSITVALYGAHNTKKRVFNKEYVDAVSFERIESIYKSRFGNAADFEFFIVGDLDKETLKPLLEKYIASISTSSEKEQWKDNSVSWLENNTVKNVYLKMTDPKSIVNICYKNNMTFSLKNQMLARILSDMLRLRYDETLREQEGGTYGADTYGSVSKRPIEQAFIVVNFDCNPDKTDKLVGIVHDEINKIANGTIVQQDLDKTLTNFLKDRKQGKDLNSYDMDLLTNFYREGYNMEKAENFETIIKSIKKQDLQSFTKSLLKDAKSYQLVFKPQL